MVCINYFKKGRNRETAQRPGLKRCAYDLTISSYSLSSTTQMQRVAPSIQGPRPSRCQSTGGPEALPQMISLGPEFSQENHSGKFRLPSLAVLFHSASGPEGASITHCDQESAPEDGC